jgi:hypothetical protein
MITKARIKTIIPTKCTGLFKCVIETIGGLYGAQLNLGTWERSVIEILDNKQKFLTPLPYVQIQQLLKFMDYDINRIVINEKRMEGVFTAQVVIAFKGHKVGQLTIRGSDAVIYHKLFGKDLEIESGLCYDIPQSKDRIKEFTDNAKPEDFNK